MIVKDIQIKLPWGHASGIFFFFLNNKHSSLARFPAKAWGDKRGKPVIALHGFQDNANTFDKLIPILPTTFHYICIDLPSHGKSTHLPTKLLPSLLDYVIVLKLLLDELGYKKYILMGHSFGARTSVFFAQIYPEYVDKIVTLDATYYFPVEPHNLPEYYREMFKAYEKSLRNKKTVPVYNEEEILERTMHGRYSEISEPSARILMRRSMEPMGGMYRITTAQHLKYCLYSPMSYEFMLQLLKTNPIRCPMLVLLAEEGEGLGNEEVLKEFAKNKDCTIRLIEGRHDVHMDQPERVAPIITDFLINCTSKL